MNIITHTREQNRTDDEIEDMLNEIYGTVSICGSEYDSGYLLRKLDPIAFGMVDSDDPLPDIEEYECGECGSMYNEIEDAEECCNAVDDDDTSMDCPDCGGAGCERCGNSGRIDSDSE